MNVRVVSFFDNVSSYKEGKGISHGGLITIAIPELQWPICAQYSQTGSVLFTVVTKTWLSVPLLGVKKPLKIPGVDGWQGLAKVDWATE